MQSQPSCDKWPAQWPYSHCKRLLPFGGVCVIAFVSSLWLSIYSYLHIWTGPKPVPFVFSQFGRKHYTKNKMLWNYSYCHIYRPFTGTEYTAADIFLNISYLWLAIGPSWLIHNTAGFVATPKGPATKTNSEITSERGTPFARNKAKQF